MQWEYNDGYNIILTPHASQGNGRQEGQLFHLQYL